MRKTCTNLLIIQTTIFSRQKPHGVYCAAGAPAWGAIIFSGGVMHFVDAELLAPLKAEIERRK